MREACSARLPVRLPSVTKRALLTKRATMADDQPWKIPPIVQELAAGAQTTPSRYVVREQDRPDVACAVMPEPTPLVDLSRLSAASDEVAKLRSALQSWGLFLVILCRCSSVPLRFVGSDFDLSSAGRWTWNGTKSSCRNDGSDQEFLQAPHGREAEVLQLGERQGVQGRRVRQRHGRVGEPDPGLVRPLLHHHGTRVPTSPQPLANTASIFQVM
jgi:hypothetical protein